MTPIVSITLQNNDDARPIIEAICADNPGVKVATWPGVVKLDREQHLVINRHSVAQRLGRDWDPQEIHLVIVSMAGNIDEDDDHVILAWNR